RRATARRRAVPRTAVGRPPARRRPPRSAASTTSQHCEEAEMTVYAAPGTAGAIAEYEPRYHHWIGGGSAPPSSPPHVQTPSPGTGRTFTEVARGNAVDVERALDAAHGAARSWGRTSATERAVILNTIADRMEQNLERIAVAETWENGKPVRETLAADIPLA